MRSTAALRLVTVVSFLVAVAVSPALACYWDRDTLAMEAKGLPGVVEVVTGRFFRPPPEFYEMRLVRVVAEIEADGARLELYDDAAVACDRLGRGDEAIAWMERKRAEMDAAAARDGDIGDHEYRYHANLGTFYVHRWLRGGADRTAMGDAELAQEHIALAIEINPDAHFGREAYQLLAIEWLIDPPEWQGVLPSVFDAAMVGGIRVQPHGSGRIGGIDEYYGIERPAEGLSGLVVLGNAWESFDIFYTLGIALNSENAATLSELARLRCEELSLAGRGSMYPMAMVLDSGDPELSASEVEHDAISFLGIGVTGENAIVRFYRRAREEAKVWHQAKTDYMLAELQTGSHPDTDEHFWGGFDEPSPPALPGTATLFFDSRVSGMGIGLWVGRLAGAVTVLVVGLIVIRVVRRMRRESDAV